jgi:hypothetical protein
MVNGRSQTIQFSKSSIGPVGKSFDLFRDNSIVFVSTPGIVWGHCSVKITGKDGKYVIIGGDAAYLPESFSGQNIPASL